MKAYVIGAGIAGAASARILKNSGVDVEVFDTRPYIAGNCHDFIDKDTGCTVHTHGPHAFHSSNKKVWDWINQFGEWNHFVMEVWARTNAGLIPLPYSDMADKILGRRLSDTEIRDLVFRDYSKKLWGADLEQLPSKILNRIPLRKKGNIVTYTGDIYSGVPKLGFINLFENILSGIPTHVGVDKNLWKKLKTECDLLVYTGKVDDYFNQEYGPLGYRSLKIVHMKKPKPLHMQLNECNMTNSWLRDIDQSCWTNQNTDTTIVSREYPEEYVANQNEPYYCSIFGDSMQRAEQYKTLIEKEKTTIFAGRTATYKYLTISETISHAYSQLRKLNFKDSVLE